MNEIRASLFAILGLIVSACSTPQTIQGRYEQIDSIFAGQPFQKKWVSTNHFDVLAFVKQTSRHDDWVVYLEGDGFAWKTKYHLSSDPTPRNPMAAKLAALDKHTNVIWIARPCQYVLREGRGRNCSSSYWSSHRFSRGIVESIRQSITILTGGEKVHLVGFSGGGAIAAIIAGEDKGERVLSLRTVAGNIDHKVFTSSHNISPLNGSLNPTDYAMGAQSISQMHFIGNKDKVIRSIVFNSWFRKSGQSNCIKKHVEADISHTEGWTEKWAYLSKNFPRCF